MTTFKFFAFALVLALMLVTAAWAMSPVVHHVLAGGPDACEATGSGDHPGCDGNFSLSAREYADGSMSGQYTDQFGQGEGGFHAEINCVSVVGDDAWVSGVITQGTFGGVDLTGFPVATRVRDNGTSANDPPDQIHFSRIGDPRPCTLHVPYVLFDAPEGQVSVR